MLPGSAPVRDGAKHHQPLARPGIRVRHLADCVEQPWTGQTRGVWVDVETPTANDLASLQAAFAFHPLALEDALERGHWGRFEAYSEHDFLIFRTLSEPEDVNEHTERVSYFYYPTLESLVTIRNEPVTYLERIWLECRDRRDAFRVVYALLTAGTETFFDFVDALEERTDELEEQVFNPKLSALGAREFSSDVFALKHTMLAARRILSNAREGVAQFSRHLSSLHPEGGMYLRDVSDHLARVYDSLDSERDVLSGLLDVHLSVQSNRMNEVMKTLTTVSTIFLPLTFLAGVWGMNFHFMPELGQPWGYALAWGAFVLVGVLLATYFRKRGWW